MSTPPLRTLGTPWRSQSMVNSGRSQQSDRHEGGLTEGQGGFPARGILCASPLPKNSQHVLTPAASHLARLASASSHTRKHVKAWTDHEHK